MMEEGQPETSETSWGGIHDRNQQGHEIPQERAGVEKGVGANIVAKYTQNKAVLITVIDDSQVQRAKRLYVAAVRKNPTTNKPEYQLKEEKDIGEADEFYRKGIWFSEKEVRRA